MNILTHMGAALSGMEDLEAESTGMVNFFAAASRTRAATGWGPRQRRRDRIRRRAA